MRFGVSSTEPVHDCRWFHQPLYSKAANVRHDGIHKFQKEVRVADANSNQIHDNRVSEQCAERKHDPRQVRCIERQETQKDHSNILVAATPDICHHESEGVSKKVNVGVI